MNAFLFWLSSLDWRTILLGFLIYNIVFELGHYLLRQSPFLLWRLIISLGKFVTATFLTWLYERLYLNEVETKLKQELKPFSPLQVWGQSVNQGILVARGGRVPKGDLLDCVDDYDRVVLVGGAGSGKTTALKYLVARYSTQALRNLFGKGSVIPIYIPLSGLEKPSTEGLLTLISQTASRYERLSWLERHGLKLGSRVSTRIGELLEEDRLILLLDGINEISGDISKRAIEMLNDFADTPKYAHTRMILTTRPGIRHEQTVLKLNRISLAPFSDSSMNQFLNSRDINPGAALRHLESLHMKDVCRNPGVLEMFARSYKRSGHALPPTRGQVFKDYVTTLLAEGEPKWNSTYPWRWVDEEILIGALGKIAYAMVNDQIVRIPIRRAKDLIGNVTNALDIFEQAHFCLLTEYSADKTELRFAHDLLRNYFAAEELERRLRESGYQDTQCLLADEKWWEPILLQAYITAHPLVFARGMANFDRADVNLCLSLGCLLSADPRQLEDEEDDEARALVQHLTMELLLRLKEQHVSEDLQKMCLYMADKVGMPFVQVLAKLTETTYCPEASVRQFGVRLLSAIDSVYSSEYLIRVLSDSNPEVAQAAANSLVELVSTIEFAEECIADLITLIIDDAVYRRAISVLIAMKGSAKSTLLLRALQVEIDANIRATLRYVLFRIGDSETAMQTSPSQVSDNCERITLRAIEFLLSGKGRNDLLTLLREKLGVDNRRCLEPLLELAKHSDEEVATAAISSLRFIGDTDALPVIVEIAENLKKGKGARLAAIKAMHSLDPVAATPVLTELIQLRDWEINATVYDLLKTTGQGAVGHLLPYLDSPDNDLKRQVIHLLADIGDKRIAPRLVNLANHPDWSVRCAVAKAIGILGEGSLKPVLENLSTDANEFVKRQALSSLDAIKNHRIILPTTWQPYDLGGILTSYLDSIEREKLPFLYLIMFRMRSRTTELFINLSADESFHLRQGMAYYSRQDYSQAAAEFSRALGINPRNPLTYLGRAIVWLAMNKYEDALQDCDYAIRLKADWALVHLVRARINLALLRPPEALADAAKAVSLSPNLPLGRLFLGDAYLLSQQLAAATSQYRKALELNPGMAAAHAGLARISMFQLDLEDAYIHINTTIELAPNWSQPVFLRSVLLGYADRTDLMLKDLESAIELEHASSFASTYAAIHNFFEKKFDEVVIHCQIAEKINPYDPLPSYLKMMVWLIQGLEEQVIQESERWIRMYPSFPIGYFCRGLALLTSGKLGLALDDLNRFIIACPFLAHMYIFRASIYFEFEFRDLAWKDLDKAIEMCPSSALIRAARSHLFFLEQRFQDAIEELNRAIELSPSTWSYYHQRGMLRMQNKDLEGAEEDLNLAKKLWPEGGLVFDAFASLKIVQGRFEEATRLIDVMSEFAPETIGIDFKRALLILARGEVEEALNKYSSLVEHARSMDIENALVDIKLCPNIPEDLRTRVCNILESHRKPGLDLFDWDLGFSVMAPLLT